MKTRKLGSNGPEVSAVGLGCMGMSIAYGEMDEESSIATIHRALEIGVTLINTADMYGKGKNEELVGRALKGRRDEAIVTTKFGQITNPDGTGGVDGRPEYVQEACEASLQRLSLDHVDLYCQHRVDSDVPIEETVGAMERLIEQGKTRYIGLSEAGADTIRRAHATHPITCLETEYSLWTRDVEAEILPACCELGIGFVAYAPLGRGFLSGAYHSPNDFREGDRRLDHPRFNQEHMAQNISLLDTLEKVATGKGFKPAQLAISWLLHQGDDIVPIPGTQHPQYLEQNARAVDLQLQPQDIKQLSDAFPVGVASGDRYPADAMKKLGI